MSETSPEPFGFSLNMELEALCLGFLALERFILLLIKNCPLILVLFIILKILTTFTVWWVAFEWLRSSSRYVLDPRKWFSKAELVQQKSKTSLQETKTVEKGITEDAARRTPYQRLCQLFCKQPACPVCRRVPQEAWKRADGGRYAKPRSLLSPWPCQESKISSLTSVEEEEESCLWTSSVTTTLSFGPEGTASTITSRHVPRVPVGQKASKPTPQDRKTRDSFSGELDVYMEDFSSSSSSTYETSSISTWTDSSGYSTTIFSRLKSHRSRTHHQSVLRKQKISRGSPKQSSPEVTKVEELCFSSPPVSFMNKTMIQSLESHWVAKRLQHLLGMSWILLRSLRSFMPSAPASSLGRPLGVTVVVRRPRVLAFVSAKTKRKLELHLKKRVHLKHWQLPRRVQEALRHMKPPPLPKIETSLVQKPGRKAKRSVVTGPPLLQKSLDVIQMKVKLHLAKKCVEIQAEVFPDVALHSWRCSVWLAKQPLPKLVSPADKPSQARQVFLPFVLPQEAKKMELAVQRWRLSSCWDLGKRYVESLVAVAPLPSSSKPFPGRSAASEFSGAQTPFLQQRGRETLEAHVRKKRLEHEWGLPSVIRRSLKAFLPSVVPHGSVLHKAKSRFNTLPQKLGFLPKDTCIVLEFHLQRMKLQRRWGLPRRVLETYLRLFPELPYKEKRVAVKPLSQHPRLGVRPPPEHPKQGEEKARKIQGLQLCPAQPLLILKTEVLKKLQVHLTKKHLEVCLQSFPAASRISWRSSQWSQKRPLPKLILPGLKTPQIRMSCSSCSLAAMGRIESALQRGRLSSLWGLGLKYMEAITEMATIIQQDAEKVHPSDGTKEFGFQFVEGKTPFLQPLAREVLEMHLRKKRIQHQWGLPFLVQRSLRSFSSCVSPLHHSKAVTQASVLPRELLFLPQKVTNFLEFHLQKRKLQQRWGLPRRVLDSCQHLFPRHFYKEKTTLLVKHYSRKPGLEIKTWAGDLVKPQPDVQKMHGLCPAQSLHRLSLQALKKLEVHLAKKHLEVCLETFPSVPRFSWRSVWLSTNKSLPKLVLPGLKTPQTRKFCLSFDLTAMGRIEVALQRSRLMSLWGLGLKFVETLAAMCPGGPLSSVKSKEVPFEFSEVKSPFFKNAVKENLEMHIKKKRLQHEWGYSTLVQRSLRSLFGEAPHRHRDLLKAATQTSLLHLKLCFLSEPVKQNLELHIQRMKLQRRWGVPKKVHRFVKFFHSLLPEEKPQAKFSLEEPQLNSARWEETNTLLPKNMGCLKDLPRYTLETHLKKKSLEIKFQLIGYEMFPGPIKHAFLPKCSSVSSEIKPRRSCLYFVEQSIVEKINLNIKRKHLTHLWGLPNIYTKSLNKMFGDVVTGRPPLEMSKFRRWTPEKNIGQESQTAGAMGFRTKELRFSRKGPCFVQTEILDLLEMHVRRKKLQHEWGLPSMVQKSLQAFAALSLEPERLLERLAIATTTSRGVLKVTIKITKSLFFLDLATQKLLEAHMKTQIAAHRWGLPKRVQESLKMFLPLAASSQVEGDQGQAKTLWHAHNRLFQTATKQRHKAENVHRVITAERVFPKANLLGEMSEEKISRFGREKMTPGKETTPMFLKQEDLEFMGLHVRHKRIQHEWGLPTLVQKSLQAFVPVPPEPQKRSLTGLALERLGDGRKTSRVVHGPRSMIRVLVPHQYFLSQDAKDHLEHHVSCQSREHKWGLPQLIQDSLRAMVPPLQVPDEKNCDRGEVQILSQDPNFLRIEEKELLEVHLRHLTSEHRWGLPKRVQRSLRAFLPPRSPSHSEMTGSLPLLPYPPTATYVEPSWTSKGTEDPQILPPSSPSSYITQNYMSNVGKPENRASFQNVKLGSGKTMPKTMNKMPLPDFKAKMITWQMEDGSPRTAKQRDPLEGLPPPPKSSAASRELKKSPNIPSCLSCHSSDPKKTSISSSRQSPTLAENAALSLVDPSEEPSDQVYYSRVAEADEDHDALKPDRIPDSKDVVICLKRQTPVDLKQAEIMGQDGGAQHPHLPRGMRPIGCSPGQPAKAGKKKRVKVSWSSTETHQELLLVRKLVFDPKLRQALEVPRQGVNQRPQEERSPGSKKMTILGDILEKKLNLQQGLFIWRQSPRPKEKEGRDCKRDKREGGGGRQRGRPTRPSSSCVDKQSSILSTILQEKLHLCRNILKGKLCFWKKSQEKSGDLPKTRRTGKSGGVRGEISGAAK